MTDGLVYELAEWVTELRRDQVPDSAIHAARRLLLDRLGIAVGGHRLSGAHPTATLAARMSGQPAATVWATGAPAFAPYAALANGCAGDALELAAEPTCAEAGFAAAEAADRTLGELLLGIVAGAEVGGYLRRWLTEPLERHGLHPVAHVGGYAAVTTAGRLLGLSTDALAGALASVACLSPQAPYASFSGGATGKTLYGGWPHFLGLWACLWASGGTVGPATALEGSRGVGQALLDTGGPIEPPAFRPAVDGWEIEHVHFKPYPCNRGSHPTLTVLERFGRPDWSEIESVHVWTYPYAVELDRRSRGDDPTAAQMSIRTTVALSLVLGGLEPGAFSAGSLADPRVGELAGRVAVEVDPRYAGEGPRIRGARVRLTLRGGRVLDERTDEAKWGRSAPATDEELMERFRFLTAGGSVGGLDPLNAPEATKARAWGAAFAHQS